MLDEPADLALGLLHLGVERGGGDARRAVAEDDDLLQIVAGGDADAALLAQFIGGALDVRVGGLRLLGVDHLHAVHGLHRAGVAFDLVRVEYKDHHAFAEALIIRQHAGERGAGGGDVLRGELVQLVPREDDVVAVDQQIFRAAELQVHVVLPVVQRLARRRLRRLERLALDLAVGTLKDGLQLTFVLKRAGLAPTLGRGRFLTLGGVEPYPADAVHHGGSLVPRHGDAAAMVAEHRRRGILHVALRIVADGGDHRVRVAAGLVAPHGAAQPPGAAGVNR